MRAYLGMSALAVALGAAAPTPAATIVLLPSPGSMSPARIVSDGSDSKDVYVCTAPGELSSRHCSLQRSAPSHRRG